MAGGRARKPTSKGAEYDAARAAASAGGRSHRSPSAGSDARQAGKRLKDSLQQAKLAVAASVDALARGVRVFVPRTPPVSPITEDGDEIVVVVPAPATTTGMEQEAALTARQSREFGSGTISPASSAGKPEAKPARARPAARQPKRLDGQKRKVNESSVEGATPAPPAKRQLTARERAARSQQPAWLFPPQESHHCLNPKLVMGPNTWQFTKGTHPPALPQIHQGGDRALSDAELKEDVAALRALGINMGPTEAEKKNMGSEAVAAEARAHQKKLDELHVASVSHFSARKTADDVPSLRHCEQRGTARTEAESGAHDSMLRVMGFAPLLPEDVEPYAELSYEEREELHDKLVIQSVAAGVRVFPWSRRLPASSVRKPQPKQRQCGFALLLEAAVLREELLKQQQQQQQQQEKDEDEGMALDGSDATVDEDESVAGSDEGYDSSAEGDWDEDGNDVRLTYHRRMVCEFEGTRAMRCQRLQQEVERQAMGGSEGNEEREKECCPTRRQPLKLR